MFYGILKTFKKMSSHYGNKYQHILIIEIFTILLFNNDCIFSGNHTILFKKAFKEMLSIYRVYIYRRLH